MDEHILGQLVLLITHSPHPWKLNGFMQEGLHGCK